MTFRTGTIITVAVIHVATVLGLVAVIIGRTESMPVALDALRRLTHDTTMQLVYAGWLVCCGLLAFIVGRYGRRERGMPLHA
jgi:uncharacterized membrane protein